MGGGAHQSKNPRTNELLVENYKNDDFCHSVHSLLKWRSATPVEVALDTLAPSAVLSIAPIPVASARVDSTSTLVAVVASAALLPSSLDSNFLLSKYLVNQSNPLN